MVSHMSVQMRVTTPVGASVKGHHVLQSYALSDVGGAWSNV